MQVLFFLPQSDGMCTRVGRVALTRVLPTGRVSFSGAAPGIARFPMRLWPP